MPLSTRILTVTIAAGESLSSAAALAGRRLVGIGIPAEWDAAGVGFHVSYDDGTTYVQLCAPRWLAAPPHSVDEVELLAASIPTAEAIVISLDYLRFLPVTHVKVRSQTTGSAVNQTAARTVKLFVVDAV